MQAASIGLTIVSVFLIIAGFALAGREGSDTAALFFLGIAGLAFAAILYNRYSRGQRGK